MQEARTELCDDCPTQIVRGTTCDSCPSRPLSERFKKAMSDIHDQDADATTRAIISELASIRELAHQHTKVLVALDEHVRGNGKPGMSERLVVIETQLSTSTKTVAAFAAISTAIVSALIAAFALLRS